MTDELPEHLFHKLTKLPISWRVLDQIHNSRTYVSEEVAGEIYASLGFPGWTEWGNAEKRFMESIGICDGKSPNDLTAPFLVRNP